MRSSLPFIFPLLFLSPLSTFIVRSYQLQFTNELSRSKGEFVYWENVEGILKIHLPIKLSPNKLKCMSILFGSFSLKTSNKSERVSPQMAQSFRKKYGKPSTWNIEDVFQEYPNGLHPYKDILCHLEFFASTSSNYALILWKQFGSSIGGIRREYMGMQFVEEWILILESIPFNVPHENSKSFTAWANILIESLGSQKLKKLWKQYTKPKCFGKKLLLQETLKHQSMFIHSLRNNSIPSKP